MKFLYVFLISSLFSNEPVQAQELSGGEGSVDSSGPTAFSLPMKNITKKHRKSFSVGHSTFRQNWVTSPASVKTRQGLGTLFNATSCSSCHAQDGRGQPPLENSDKTFSSILVRLSVPGTDEHGAPLGEPHYGGQFNHRAILNVAPEGDVKIIYKQIADKFEDGTEYTLLIPQLEFSKLAYGEMAKDTMFSLRVAPQTVGLGLLEAITEKDILKKVDPEDKDGDGIKGRVNHVWDYTQKRKRIGRLGWKANQPDIAQQNVSASLGDIGLTSALFPQQSCTSVEVECANAYALPVPEIDSKELEELNTYTRTLAVPIRRHIDDPNVQSGEKLFKAMNCVGCHTESFVTGVDKKFPEVSKQKIHPYTDLLIHDMGEGLADHRPDFEAGGNDWRTPPLWGIGLIKVVNGHTRFLHDGRARNLEEAILWHGGEALKSQVLYKKLAKNEREQVIQFLESL